MIVGNGLIAKSFEAYQSSCNFKDTTIFASGVSNSQSNNDLDCQREIDLLLKQNRKQKIFYFSTCSVYDTSAISTSYVMHKINMEKIIVENFPRYLIIRLPQVVGEGGNPANIFNFLLNAIKNGEVFKLQSAARRSFVDSADIPRLSDSLLKFQNDVINLAPPGSISVAELVGKIERLLKKQSKHLLVNEGSSYPIDISKIRMICAEYDSIFTDDYIDKLLLKYIK